MLQLYPLIFAFAYWVILFIFIGSPSLWAYTIAALGFLYGVTVAVVSGGRALVFRHWNIWTSFALFLLMSFLFVAIIPGGPLRNLYVGAYGVISGLSLLALVRFFQSHQLFSSRVYLQVVSFLSLLTFWQFTVMLYFSYVSLGFSKWLSLSVMVLVTYILVRGIFSVHQLVKSSTSFVLMVITLTTAELFIFIELLPLHYFVLGSIVTLWLYFILEVVLRGQELASRKKIFNTYLAVFLTFTIVLLLTARWG